MDPTIPFIARVLSWLGKIGSWLWRLVFGKRSGDTLIKVPPRTLTLVKEQGNSTWWHMGTGADPSMHLVCAFTATNVTAGYNALVAETYLRQRLLGIIPRNVQTWEAVAYVRHHQKNEYSSRYMIPANMISNVHCHFSIKPPMAKEGNDFIADVVVVDQFKNKHTVWSHRFPYR